MKNWLKTTVLSLLLAASFACKGQSVITQYIYEVQIYTNIIHEISNNVWTVSNITIRTQNEITQNVNRVYNYISTNFTLNISTNLYIDQVIGTNVVYEFKTNYYDIVILTNISTMVWTNILVTIPTNYDVTVNLSTNIYQTNYNTSVTRHYSTTINTNVTYNIITNEYTDLVVGTNIVYDIHTTNQESFVALSNIERNVQINADLSLRYMRESANYSYSAHLSYLMGQGSVSNAMLFAYIAIESVNRLGNTNDTYVATNSTIYTDIYGTEYSNMSNLTINNVNGDLIAIANKQYDYTGGGVGSRNHYSTSYIICIGGLSSSSSSKVTYNISHASEGIDGMRIIYLPDRYKFPYPWENIAPVCLYWNCDNLVLIQKNLYNMTFQTNMISGLSSSPYNTPWPNGMYSSYGDSASIGWVDMQGASTYNGHLPQLKTKFGLPPTTDIPCIMISRFPSLSDWKIMWEITNLTEYQFFR